MVERNVQNGTSSASSGTPVVSPRPTCHRCAALLEPNLDTIRNGNRAAATASPHIMSPTSNDGPHNGEINDERSDARIRDAESHDGEDNGSIEHADESEVRALLATMRESREDISELTRDHSDPFKVKIKVHMSGAKEKTIARLDTGWEGPNVMSERLVLSMNLTIEDLEPDDSRQCFLANNEPFRFRGKVKAVRWEGKSLSTGHPVLDHFCRRGAMWIDDFFVPELPLPNLGAGTDIIISNRTIRECRLSIVLLAGFDGPDGFHPMDVIPVSDKDAEICHDITEKLAAQNRAAKRNQKAKDKRADAEIRGNTAPKAPEVMSPDSFNLSRDP